MKSPNPLIWATLACLTLSTGYAGAAEVPGTDGTAKARPRPDMMRVFQAADANGDQKVTFAELQAKLPNFPEKRFKNLDANQDGVLEAGELPTPAKDTGAPGEAMRARMQQADRDQDGRVSAQEFAQAFPKAPATRFSTLDRNNDGFLDPSDRAAAAESAPDIPRKNARKAGDPSASSRTKGAGADARKDTARYARKLLAHHDADGDGSLTFEELQAGKRGFPRESFSAFDRNKDGILSAADFGQD